MSASPRVRNLWLTIQERNQLISCPVCAEGKSYRVEAVNSVQPQDHIVVLQFINEHGDWVELVILVRFHGGQSVSGDEEGGWGLATVSCVEVVEMWRLAVSGAELFSAVLWPVVSL
jgi:hypothetical protein